MIKLVGGPLHQWETGRFVEITGDNLQYANEIQFANSNDSAAVAVAHRVAMVYDGPYVAIPDRYLQSGKSLIVYVVETREDETQYRSEILETKVFPVKAKPKPKEYVPTAAEEAYGIVKKLSDDAKAAAQEAGKELQHAWDIAEAAQIAADNAAASAELANKAAETLIPLEVTAADGKALYTSLQIHNAVMDGQNVFLNIGHTVHLTTSSNLNAVFVEFVEAESVCKVHIVDSTGIYKKEEFHLSRLLSEDIDLNGKNITNLGDSGVVIYAYDSVFPTVVFSSNNADVVLRGILAGEGENEAVNVAQLQVVQRVVTEHDARIDAVEKKQLDAEGAISYAERSIADLSDRTDSVENDLTELFIGLDDAEQALSDAEKNIKDLETAAAGTADKLKEKAEIDDGKVGSDAWSSKNIVDKLCPAFEKTGTVVQCEPVDGYPLEVTANVDGLITVLVCGKNLFNPEKYPLVDGYYIKRTNGGRTESENYCSTEEYIPVTHLRGKHITLNYPPTGNYPCMAFYDADKVYLGEEFCGKGKNIEVPNNAVYMRFSTFIANIAETQIELGGVASGYEPYWERGVHGIGSAVVMANKGINTVVGYRAGEPIEITVTGKADPVALNKHQDERIAALEKSLTALLEG